MSRYAENTSVSAAKSREEIERILERYGATAFMYGKTDQKAMVQFQADGRLIRFVMAMPDPFDREFTHTPERGNKRSDEQRQKQYEQATRQSWRALSLVIKAKLEAVEAGISEFEREFLAHIVLPDGTTVGDYMAPQLEEAYESGRMPTMLPQLES